MPTKPTVRTRFAPSPTGALHIGGARTALYNYLFAKQHGGEFILRIEDTDRKRHNEDAVAGILRDMQWLGLTWDEGPQLDGSQRGPCETYFQSERLDRYLPLAEQLIDEGKAYKEDNGAIRFRADSGIAFTDEVFGDMRFDAADLEDFIIMKAPSEEGEHAGQQFPTYHLAVVVDDHDMEISHVIRGQEHLTNTAKHIALFQAFGWDVPTFAHTPSIMNPDGSKMSKRDKAKAARAAAKDQGFEPEGDNTAFLSFMNKDNDELATAEMIANALGLALPEINVADFEQSGYLPATLLNYLALLGWNPGNDVEKFDMAFMIKNFSLSRVNKANSKFDRTKLLSFNQDAIAAMEPEAFATALKNYGTTIASQRAFESILSDKTKCAAFAEAYQPRAQTLRDSFEQGRFLVLDSELEELTPDLENKGIKKALLKGEAGQTGLDALRAFLPTIEALKDEPDFGTKVHDAIGPFCDEHGYGMGKVAQPIRVAVSGTTVTPPLDVTLNLLGADETIKRIHRLLDMS